MLNNSETIDPVFGETSGGVLLEAEDEELHEELQRMGLAEDLVACVMKGHVSEVVNFGSAINLLPVDIVTSSLATGGLSAELMSLGLRQTVEKLRPFGSTLLLGESLLSLSRSSRMYEKPEVRIEWILTAINVFKEIKALNRMGRAYIDLGTTLKDLQELYDALRAFEVSTEISISQQDAGGLAASYYHRAHICRLLGQEFEALRLLDKADKSLPNITFAESWQKQIITERIFNNLQLKRDLEALKYTDQWINTNDEHFFSYFYRGEIRERNDDLELALADYCKAIVLLSRDILKNKTDRFRRFDRGRNDFMFRRGLKLALKLDKPEIALALLQLANTGGLGLLSLNKNKEGESNSSNLLKLRNRISALSKDAVLAISQNTRDEMSRLNEIADWLISEQEFLLTDSDESFLEVDDLKLLSNKIKSNIPKDAALIELTTVGNEVWLISITNESINSQKLSLESFDLNLLTQSFKHECEGVFTPTALTAMSNEIVPYIEPILKTKNSLIIALNPELYGIPFHAMEWLEKPLVESHEISYVTSSLSLIHNKTTSISEPINASSSCVFLATPNVNYSKVDDLPGIRNEIETISRMFNKFTLRIDSPSNSEDLLSLKNPPRVLHIACHGKFEPTAPLLSRLLMEDRPVFAFEIMTAKIDVDLAVISACQTGQAAIGVGSHTQSLASAFLKAGVKYVVAALWNVDDSAGSLFIKEFYKSLVNEETPVKALHIAQRNLRANEDFSHPYFWAPFIIFGTSNRKQIL